MKLLIVRSAPASKELTKVQLFPPWPDMLPVSVIEFEPAKTFWTLLPKLTVTPVVRLPP